MAEEARPLPHEANPPAEAADLVVIERNARAWMETATLPQLAAVLRALVATLWKRDVVGAESAAVALSYLEGVIRG